jgi:hypothetical protein
MFRFEKMRQELNPGDVEFRSKSKAQRPKYKNNVHNYGSN